jgi:hypothetical protein
MTKFHIREWRTDQILHTVEIAKETPSYVPDLRGVSLENAILNGADLRSANLAGVCLRGAKLREAILDNANLCGADLSYSDLTGATLNGANLDGTIFYPCQMPKSAGALHGAKFASGSEVAAEYLRMIQEMCIRMRIKSSSVAYRKLQRTYGFQSSVPSPDIRPREKRGRPRWLVESI